MKIWAVVSDWFLGSRRGLPRCDDV